MTRLVRRAAGTRRPAAAGRLATGLWAWRLALGCGLSGLAAAPAAASDRARPPAASETLCGTAVAAAERAGLAARAPGLLAAIGLVESGRADPRTGRVSAWPWTINVAGDGYNFASKAEAIQAVHAAQQAGVRSIDVGCMQVSLLYHPGAFATLDEAFDPGANAAYAAGFLGRLFVQLGDWPHAAAAYHSRTQGISEAYGRRVMAVWPLAGRFGGAVFGTAPGDVAGVREAAHAAPAPQEAAVDPYHVMTPQLRARLQAEAGDHARWAAMGLLPSLAVAGAGRRGSACGGAGPAVARAPGRRAGGGCPCMAWSRATGRLGWHGSA